MQKKKPSRSSSVTNQFHQTHPLVLACIDIVITGLCLLVFAYFDHVHLKTITKVTYMPLTSASVPASGNPVITNSNPPENVITEQSPAPILNADFSERFAGMFLPEGQVNRTADSYQSHNVNISMRKVREDDTDETYYIADIYIRSMNCLRTLFAKDTYGTAYESVVSMSKRSNAIVAINSDYYCLGNAGIVIRNGVLYRDVWEPGEEVLVIFGDGTMKVYYNESEFDADTVMAQGAWQAFSFGPAFLDGDGQLRTSGYERTNHDPRTVIGMVEPGHYMFIVVDGRQTGYSVGMTYTETARLCQSLGLMTAYNLDGGQTSQMTFLDAMFNKPYKDGRTTCDIVYIADIEAER